MKDTNDVLGGFNAVFGAMSSNGSIGAKDVEVINDPNDPSNDTNPFDFSGDDDTDDVDDTIDGDKLDNIPAETNSKDGDNESTDDSTNKADDVSETEAEYVSAFFDAVAEQIGWSGIADEEKPKSVEDFVAYIKESVEASSVPAYSSEEVAAIDDFVRNGGNIADYFSVTGNVDYDNIDITDESNQKAIIKEFLAEKGFSDVQIKRKLEKYEDADLLEDEAIDAIESLKESKEQKRKELLDTQKTAREAMIQEQQTFYNNVKNQIEALTDVRGIPVSKEDKKELFEYILKVDSDGRTQYQKDYVAPDKMVKNLVESAYFTKKGDVLVAQAKRAGETSATERLKNTLRTNKVSGSKQTINNGSPAPLWSVASKQLLRRPQ